MPCPGGICVVSVITPSANITLGEHDPRTPEAKRDPDSAERVLSSSDYSEEDYYPRGLKRGGDGGEENDANEGCSRSWRAQTELQRNTRLHPKPTPQTTTPPPLLTPAHTTPSATTHTTTATTPARTIYIFMQLL